MKWSPILIPFAFILALSVSTAQAQAPGTGRKVDARQLLQLAQAGHNDAVRAADASQGRIARSRPEQAPFWKALDRMNGSLRRVRAAITTPEEGFFRELENGSAALGTLRVAWARTGVPDPGVSEGLRILSTSYDLLRAGYGREALRHRQGGGLTAAERERFQHIQEAQRRFAALLRELQERAQKEQDAAMLAELRRMAEEAERIAAAQATLDAYLNALMIGDSQRGEWEGNSEYAPAEDSAKWQSAGAVVEDLAVDADVEQVYVLNLGNLNAPPPSYLQEPTEVPESLTAAVEVFEARETDPFEEEEALADEEMEEAAETDLEVYDEVLEPEEGDAETQVEDAAEAAAEVAPEVDAAPGAEVKADTLAHPAPAVPKEEKKDPRPPDPLSHPHSQPPGEGAPPPN